ncbi:SDR family oxidoreductase [Thermocoleostomius sinensis]|jgi:NADP-dependent 3-hydroxy acid dehydrogenase YdfG|uniref:SDR family oxidoreductase n=1 Tax=Thermocoleostomius sinensis A174 TaxID=2016057 RepID=A0A9E8ZIF2_9CYAN|nr:SDR family oxidoreductase [Thermocoleostomius sinensis]WAL61853.1 SDR family oxidoreductase [Thermocoleostomius sinensis A174]
MGSSIGCALITGAGSGIGRATAQAFAEAGIDLALVSRSPAKLDEVAATVAQTGVTVKTYPLDLAVVDQVNAAISQIAAELPIDILVNNAGIAQTGEVLSTSLSDWQRVIDLNLTSVFQCIQAVLPGMRERQRGTIVNVSSIAAHHTFAGWGAYSVSKAGIASLSKVLAAEERAYGIRVAVITPGAVNTPIWDTIPEEFDRSQMLTPDVVAQSILHTVLLPPQAVIDELIVMPRAGAI